MRKALASVGIGAVLAVGLGAAAVPTASAATYPGCDHGYSCIWKDKNYNGFNGMGDPYGAWARIGDTKNDFTRFRLRDGSAASNSASSIGQNLRQCEKGFFYDYRLAPYNGGTGSYVLFHKGTRDPYLANGGGSSPYKDENWDNRISSNWYKSCIW
ncbi:hypothetical protein [Isoptericola sp. NPDC057191]|uniref:hypothetical protein n=1 Tax=Isoptericola sp. NPDC057191 TaxID=3346041 RepID=UPI00362E46B2